MPPVKPHVHTTCSHYLFTLHVHTTHLLHVHTTCSHYTSSTHRLSTKPSDLQKEFYDPNDEEVTTSKVCTCNLVSL